MLRTLLLAPGAVIMYANGATMETFRKFEVLWWALLDDYLAGFREEKKSHEACRGSRSSTGSQQHFWLPKGLHGGLIFEHAQGREYEAWSNYRSRIQHVTETEDGFINLFLSLSSSIYYYHEKQQKLR